MSVVALARKSSTDSYFRNIIFICAALYFFVGLPIKAQSGRVNVDEIRPQLEEMNRLSDTWVDCSIEALPPLAAKRDISAQDAASAAVDGCSSEGNALSFQLRIVWRMGGLPQEEALKQFEDQRTSLIRSLASLVVKARAGVK